MARHLQDQAIKARNTSDDLIIANLNAKGTLAGGGGNDIFEGSFTGLPGDTITDMSAGDSIRFTDPSAFYGFGFERSGASLTYAGMDGLHFLTLSNIPSGHFVATPFQANDQHGYSGTAIGDFNGDGRSDLLWRQSGSGMLAEWLMDGSQITSSQIIGATPNSARQVQSRPPIPRSRRIRRKR